MGQRILLIFIVLIFSVGCQALAVEDVPGTMSFELTAYATEAAGIRLNSQTERTQVAATVAVAETQSANYSLYNNVLVATVRADQIPTPSERLAFTDGGVMAIDMFDLSDGQMRFLQVGTAGYVRPEDRCFETHQTFFRTSSTNRIYMTALALNLQAGTNLRVDWFYEGSRVHTSAWSAPSFTEGMCIAIELSPANAPFLPGNWSATLFVNGNAIDPSAFSIIEG